MHRKPVRAAAAAAVVVAGLLTAAGPVRAAPAPDPEKLGRQAEILTEQYNGKRLALKKARLAQRAAERQARQAGADYETVRRKAGVLAASQYMTPGAESEVSLFIGDEPQVALDRSAASSYLAAQQVQQLRELALTRMRYERSAGAARERTAEIQKLTKDLAGKKARIEKLISKIPASRARTGGAPPRSSSASGRAGTVVNAALSRVGTPYVYGAAGPNSFDCSGLMLWSYAKVGMNLPHYTGAQYNMGTRVSRGQVRPGDILFFYPDLGHNGMYIGGNKMVHAPRSGKNVEVVDLAAYWWGQFTGATRLL
ncbi:C40 family peptidase [Actinomadura rugatobispora]|uniref:C40 family peptidase n=1 Tax=Actinomadura rugatobispora TaxID=1994 RepID=A0ABW0ZSW9_9ACTN|nr:C40 family peptidase [Actinomadura rugatobispora]